jgi:hypothetical protein
MYAFTDAGAGSYMVRLDDGQGQESAGWLREAVEYLPFAHGPVDRTLVIGAGAGKDILQARLAGSREITAVEINPAIVALTRRYAAYNGGVLIYLAQTVIADGRILLSGRSPRPDLPEPGIRPGKRAGSALERGIHLHPGSFLLLAVFPDGRLAIISHQALRHNDDIITPCAEPLAQKCPGALC